MITKINGKLADWTDEIRSEWANRVGVKLEKDEWVSDANFFDPKPYKDQYNRGSDRAGFTYVLQPGNHVCYSHWTPIKGTDYGV